MEGKAVVGQWLANEHMPDLACEEALDHEQRWFACWTDAFGMFAIFWRWGSLSLSLCVCVCVCVCVDT